MLIVGSYSSGRRKRRSQFLRREHENMWMRGNGVSLPEEKGRLRDAGVGRLGKIRRREDGGVGLEMENADIVIIIAIVDTITDQKMAKSENLRTAKINLDQNIPNAVTHVTTTAK